MRGTLIALILAITLATPGLAAPAQAPQDGGAGDEAPAFTQGHTQKDYVLGGPATLEVLLGFDNLRTGEVTIDLRPLGNTHKAIDTDVDDTINPNVRVLYSFHKSEFHGETLIGPGESVGTGSFCTSTTLDIPDEAKVLDLRLNAPEDAAYLACLPGKATTGTVHWSFVD